MVFIPWLPDLVKWRNVLYDPYSLSVKIFLSSALLVFIFLLHDIRRKINLLDDLKKNLSMAAIHDLKGPLTSIVGALSIISDTEIDPLVREKLLGVAARSSQAMIRLIQEMLDTERMEIAKLILQPQDIDPVSHIKEVFSVFESVGRELGIKIEISFGGDIPHIRADKDLLGRVYENLLMNAFKYSPRNSSIYVKAGFENNEFCFEVSDSGAGIPVEYVEKVFEKYYRVEGQEKNSRKGSGLGLYFCKLAVEAHGGSIGITSVEKKGTRVFFKIPK